MPTMIPVVYEDEWMVVINKPAGMPSQPDKSGDLSAIDLLEQDGRPGVHPVHRIDRPVGGIVVFARTSGSAARLGELFAGRLVDRRYLALVSGVVDPPAGTLRDTVLADPRTNRSRVDPSGQECVLQYRTVAVGERYTLVEISLETGRHHQIRVQLSHRGWPVLGDLKYGARRSQPGGGIGLHASAIAFSHPYTRRQLVCLAPVPARPVWEELAGGYADECHPWERLNS